MPGSPDNFGLRETRCGGGAKARGSNSTVSERASTRFETRWTFYRYRWRALTKSGRYLSQFLEALDLPRFPDNSGSSNSRLYRETARRRTGLATHPAWKRSTARVRPVSGSAATRL